MTSRSPPLECYGSRHIPSDLLDWNTTRRLQSLRHKVVSVLPPTMRGLAEMLCLVDGRHLASFAERVEIEGGRAVLDRERVARFHAAVRRRLLEERSAQVTDASRRELDAERKAISRLLGDIDPKACRLPIDDLDPRLTLGEAVSVSASALHLGASIVGLPSAPGWPVLGVLAAGGRIEPLAPPTPLRYRVTGGAVQVE